MKFTLLRVTGQAVSPRSWVARFAYSIALFCFAATRLATAQTFDKTDAPNLEKIKALNWKDIDLSTIDRRTEVASLMAMQELLATVQGKADARRSMMAAYFELKDLVDEYLAWSAKQPEPKTITFDQGRKISVAYVRSPLSQGHFDPGVPEGDTTSLDQMSKAYLNLCLKKWDSARIARVDVESLAGFLKYKGKFQDYMDWATAESKRIKAARDADAAKRRADATAAAKANKEAAAQLAEQRRKEQHEQDMQRMQYAYQLEAENDNAGAPAATNSWSDDGYADVYYPWSWNVWGGGGGGEINGGVRDRWQNRPRPKGGRR